MEKLFLSIVCGLILTFLWMVGKFLLGFYTYGIWDLVAAVICGILGDIIVFLIDRD